jgi:hypothetical protein
MPADSATKSYTCPGCNQTVGPGTPHLVTWPREASIGQVVAVDERRHWHSGCWNRKR